MKVEFEGTAGDILQEITALLGSFGLKVEQFNHPVQEPDMGSSPTLRGVPEPPEDLPQEVSHLSAGPKPTKKVVKAKPAPEPEPSYDVQTQAESPPPEDPFEEEAPVEPNLKDALALEKLKGETLSRLKDMFVAGRGKYIRDLLKKHGHGAMVFPEVEAKHFPAIKAEIDRELGA